MSQDTLDAALMTSEGVPALVTATPQVSRLRLATRDLRLVTCDRPFGMSSDDSKAEEEPPADASPSSSSPSLAPAEASDGGGENLTPSPSQPTSGQKGELWRLYYLRLEALRSAGGAPPAGPAPAGSGSEGALTEPLLGAAGGQAVHAVPSTDFELLAPPPDLYNTDIMQQMK